MLPNQVSVWQSLGDCRFGEKQGQCGWNQLEERKMVDFIPKLMGSVEP